MQLSLGIFCKAMSAGRLERSAPDRVDAFVAALYPAVPHLFITGFKASVQIDIDCRVEEDERCNQLDH